MNLEKASMQEKLFVLEDAARHVAKLHAIDADLVRPGAKAHGVRVIEGDLFTPTQRHNYNPRIPRGTEGEAKRLADCQTIIGVCEDYRQSDEVVQELRLDPRKTAVFATAGGAVQPDSARFKADVAFYVAVFDVNPQAEIKLTYHNHVCGGANYFTGKEMEQVFADPHRGPSVETEKMDAYGLRMYEAIKAVRYEAKVSLYRSNVGPDNDYKGLSRIA